MRLGASRPMRSSVGSSLGVIAGYSPEGEGDEVDSGLVCTVAQSLASVLLLARILIDFENTIFCANDQNALRCRLLLRPRPDRVMPRSPCVYIISMPLAFAFPFRSASRAILWIAPIEGALTNGPYEMENKPSIFSMAMEKGKMLRIKTMIFAMKLAIVILFIAIARGKKKLLISNEK